jgi:phosphoribosyl-ATP pyrophosphohydrolase
MKKFEELFAELEAKSLSKDPNSQTVAWLEAGTHIIGKKIVEEAAEVWMAAEYEGKERTAEEISQLIYHLQVLMIQLNIKLEDLEKNL